MAPTRTLFMTGACFLGYFLFGFVDNMKGSTIPLILDGLGFSYADGATVVLAEYAGFVIATLLMGILADIIDKRLVMASACAFLVLGMWGYSGSSTVSGLAATFALVGVGCGAIELGGSNIIADIHTRNRGRYLNLLTCFHGVGSMAAPLFVGALAVGNDGWRFPYRLGIVLVVVVGALFVALPYPKRQRAAAAAPFSLAALRNLLTARKVMVLNGIMFCYVATEIGMATWLTDFLIASKAFPHDRALLYLSVYFGCIMVGRLAGSFVVDRLGLTLSVLLCSVGAVLMLVIGMYGSGATLLALPMVGLFYSVIFPTTTALVSGEVQANQGTALGVLFCSGGIGGMLGPWLIGTLNGSWGHGYGMTVNVLFCVGMAVGAAYLLVRARQAPDR